MSNVLWNCSRRTIISSLRPPAANSNVPLQWYSSTTPFLDEERTAPAKEKDPFTPQVLKEAAREYARRRVSYRQQVSSLRKEYMEEYQRHMARDEAQRDAEIAERTRKRLERQRAKNERSVENAKRQAELRRQMQLAFHDHLAQEQVKREEAAAIRLRAQQLLIEELEQEAPLWLTTPEEVEAAFTPEAEQLLWARPRGVLGAPNASLDAHYWEYETHTWDMSKTYKTRQDILLDEYEAEVYEKTNVDENFWTPERVAEQQELERRARLRANVRAEGRKALLMRQREYLDEEEQTSEGEPQKAKPIPSLGVLSNVRAQEKEGADLLFKDPTKFFVFDGSSSLPEGDLGVDEYSGPTLGAPVDIRDPLRTGSPQGRVFPMAVGKLPKADSRTEKEKKRQEREEKLWAAAQTQSDKNEIDMAADEDEFVGEPLDYDNNDDWDSDDEEWEKGLDPEADSELLNIPREYRYREEDIDFVIQKLEAKAEQLQSHVRNTINSMEQEARARKDRRDEEKAVAESASFLDAVTTEKLRGAGADVEKFETLLQSLTEDQLLSVFSVEAEYRASGDEAAHNVFSKVEGLTELQISELTELESFLHKIENQDDNP